MAILGCIADDFTGATDLASMLEGGMRTLQTIGVPQGSLPEDADAVVVALKSRSIPSADAIAQSLAALRRGRSRSRSEFGSCAARRLKSPLLTHSALVICDPSVPAVPICPCSPVARGWGSDFRTVIAARTCCTTQVPPLDFRTSVAARSSSPAAAHSQRMRKWRLRETLALRFASIRWLWPMENPLFNA